jgi:capsid protein
MTLYGTLRTYLATKVVGFLAENSAFDMDETTARRRKPFGHGNRSQDDDLNHGTREQLIHEARDLCQTFGLASRILRQYANYCVGTCEIDFNSGDPEWDREAEDYWKTASLSIDISGRFNLRGMTRMALIAMIRDGDIGFLKTVENGFPQLQAIEADRIRSSEMPINVDSEKDFIGGVKIDRVGRPRSFRVFERKLHHGYENPTDVNARDFILLRDPDRFDGVRGVTHFARGALNNLRDLKEILEAEKKGVKVNSRIALLIKKMAGGLPSSGVTLFGTKGDGSGTRYTEEIPDGLIKYLLPGEDAVSFASNRPSPAFTGFIEYIIRDIAISLDLPFGFVWQMLGTGPAVRLESKQAERTFQAKIDVLEWTLLNPVAVWCITWGMENGMLRFNPNWYKFEFTRPSHPSIDVGRESTADLSEHERGLITGADITQQRAKNIFKTIEQKAKEAQWAIKMAEKYEVPIEMVMSFPKATTEAEQEQMQQETDMKKKMLQQKKKPQPVEE